MPYIAKERRALLAEGERPNTAGDLAYALTRVVDDFILERGISYHTFAEIVGALETVKLELTRRKISPYEDEKLLDNGDVYRS